MRTWRPAECPAPGCIVEELYSGTAITGMGQVIQKCPAHLGVPDAALYGVLIANPDSENKRVSFTLGKIQADLRNALWETAPDANGILVFKAGIAVNFAWSGNGSTRVLTLTVTGISLTNGQKNAINNFCTSTFGAGKVVLVNV